MTKHAGQKLQERSPAVLFSRATAVAGSASDETRTVEFVASDESIDGHGTIVRQNWQLGRFEPRGVVLYAHDRDELPIGTATVRVQDGKLMAAVTFSTADLNPMAEQVWRNVKAGVLNGISAGFIPHTIMCERQNDREILVLDDNELFELSVTPCPSNANALAQMRSMATTNEERGAVPYKAYPADDTTSWDGAAAVGRVAKWASSDGSGDKDTIDWAKYRSAFAWYDAANAEAFGSYSLPHHDVVGGKLVTVRAGVIAAGNVMSGSRGGASIPEGDVDAVKAHLAKHYAQFDMKAPWEAQKQLSPPASAGSAETETEPSKEDRNMADKPAEPTNVISIARALELPAGATEGDAVSAAVRLRQLEVQVQALTGVASTAEALGALRAMKADADRAKALETELITVKAERDQQNFEALIQRGISERKLAEPALQKLEREKFERKVKEGRGAEAVEELRGWLNAKSPDGRFDRDKQSPATGAGVALTWKGKSFKDLSYTLRAALKKEDPELFKLMKEDHEATAA